MKKIIIFFVAILLIGLLIFGISKFKNNNKNNANNNDDKPVTITDEQIRKVTTDAPLTDIEKEVLKGEGGIQQNYIVENMRIENGNIFGTVTNKNSDVKSITISIIMTNSETGEQYGMIDIEVSQLQGGQTYEFSSPVSEEAFLANNFSARISENQMEDRL